MTHALPSDLQQFVDQQLATGEFQTFEELVSAGLRALRELKRRQVELRQDVQAGLAELDRGEGMLLERSNLRAFFDDIQAHGQERYEASKGHDDSP